MNRESTPNPDNDQRVDDEQAVTTQAESTASQDGTPEPPQSPKPPRAPRLWMILLIAGVAVFGLVVGSIWGPPVAERARSAIRAVSTSASDTHSEDEHEDAGFEFYTCGMHPWVILPDPGLCPICHMDLTPIDPNKFTGEISIDPIVTQNIGVRVEAVATGPVGRTIRTVGTVVYDETRVRDVNIKVPGWVESLYVDYEGAEVAVGDPLFEFYSPKLYSSQSEYLSALKMRGTVGADFLPDTKMDVERLIADARVQLEYYDITEEQIEAIEASGQPTKTMTIRSPHTGVVIAKHANEGMRVDPGMRVFQIADLSRLWVMVSLYEYQLPFVQEGQLATMSLPYIPGQEFEGRVIYIYPYLDEKTRQVQVRLEFDNPNGLLKPGMYASIKLKSTLARERTLASRSAVIDTGERQVAFVSLGEGRFEPRKVQMGVDAGDGIVEILDGLNPGEMVVTSGQFLLDSEARIRESLAKMITGDLASEQTAAVEIAGASELSSLSIELSEELASAIESYFQTSDLLATDSITGVAEPSRSLAENVDRMLAISVPDRPHFWHEHDEVAVVRGKALEIADAQDIETARLAFADLSIALVKLLKATGIPPKFDAEVQVLHCPMYRQGQGGSTWLQPAGDVRNPFFGSVMLECFDERSALPVTGQSVEPQADSPESTTDASGSEDGLTLSLDSDTQDAADSLFKAYLAVQNELTRDELSELGAHLETMREALRSLQSSAPEPVADMSVKIFDATEINTESLDTFRQGFRGLSDAMIEFVRFTPPRASVAPAVFHAYCPMAKANWLQVGKDVANPYMPNMPGCGSIKGEFEAATADGGTP